MHSRYISTAVWNSAFLCTLLIEFFISVPSLSEMVTIVVEPVPTVASGKLVPVILISKSSFISKIESSVAVTFTQSDPSVGIGPGGIMILGMLNDKSSPFQRTSIM